MATDRPSLPTTTMDPVADLLGGGRTVAYKTVLAHACGGVTVGLLLSQLWYWTNTPTVRARSDGWFWKTMEEITEETGLTRSEQESARKKLKQMGILVEAFRELPRKLYFRIDKERLYDVLRQYAEGGDNGDTREGAGPGNHNHTLEAMQEGCIESAEVSIQPALYNAGNPHYGSGETRTIACGKPAGSNAGFPQAIITEITTKKTTTNNGQGSLLPTLVFATDVVAADVDKEKSESELVGLLITAGVGKAVAQRLATAFPEECRRQLVFLPYVVGIRQTTGAYLRKAIEEGYGPPSKWEEAQREKTKRAKVEARLTVKSAQTVVDVEQRVRLEHLKTTLRDKDPQTWGEIVARAERMLAPPMRSRPDSHAYKAGIQKYIEDIILSLQPQE